VFRCALDIKNAIKNPAAILQQKIRRISGVDCAVLWWANNENICCGESGTLLWAGREDLADRLLRAGRRLGCESERPFG